MSLEKLKDDKLESLSRQRPLVEYHHHSLERRIDDLPYESVGNSFSEEKAPWYINVFRYISNKISPSSRQ